MKSTEELIDDLRDIANCQMEQPEKRNLLAAADRLEELHNDLEILAMYSEGRCVCKDLRDLVHGRREGKE